MSEGGSDVAVAKSGEAVDAGDVDILDSLPPTTVQDFGCRSDLVGVRRVLVLQAIDIRLQRQPGVVTGAEAKGSDVAGVERDRLKPDLHLASWPRSPLRPRLPPSAGPCAAATGSRLIVLVSSQ